MLTVNDLAIHAGETIAKEQFITQVPSYAIALDGYVSAEPFLYINADGQPYRNFNHHEVVDRSCTNATCEQIRKAILLGLFDLFKNAQGRPYAKVHINDCDQDVCLSTWLLVNADRAAEPLVRQLTQIEDLLDGSSGTFPMPHNRDLLGQVRWVFDPYDRIRGALNMSAAQMLQVLFDVHLRIDHFVVGKAETLPIDGAYQLLNSDRWWLARTSGANARLQMITDGCKAAVEHVGGDAAAGFYKYTLWRRSEYVAWFPLDKILDALNEAETAATPKQDFESGKRWGGSTTVGGSPRGAGSRLSPSTVQHVVSRSLR